MSCFSLYQTRVAGSLSLSYSPTEQDGDLPYSHTEQNGERVAGLQRTANEVAEPGVNIAC